MGVQTWSECSPDSLLTRLPRLATAWSPHPGASPFLLPILRGTWSTFPPECLRAKQAVHQAGVQSNLATEYFLEVVQLRLHAVDVSVEVLLAYLSVQGRPLLWR